MFLLDCGPYMFIYVGSNVPPAILNDVLGMYNKRLVVTRNIYWSPLNSAPLGVNNVSEIPDFCIELPSRETPASEALFAFIDTINEEKPYSTYIQVIRCVWYFDCCWIRKHWRWFKFISQRYESIPFVFRGKVCRRQKPEFTFVLWVPTASENSGEVEWVIHIYLTVWSWM